MVSGPDGEEVIEDAWLFLSSAKGGRGRCQTNLASQGRTPHGIYTDSQVVEVVCNTRCVALVRCTGECVTRATDISGLLRAPQR